ncbi:hypothetical protein [Paenibacillus sp. GCM10012303]|jgi:hypothetical protein|uniref:hypothetical protein n=1 Tax=Paenibacillus sp. GCM10012303 TaxID=3317340 RepID=UPI0036239D38
MVKRKFFALCLAVVTMVSGISVASADDKSTGDQNATQIITTVFNAIKNQDEGTIVKNVIDTRFPNVDAQIAAYKQDFELDPVIGFKIQQLKDLNSTNKEVSIELEFKNAGTTPAIPFNVVLEKDNWKVVLEDNYIDANARVEKIGKFTLTEGTTNGSVSPLTTIEVCYWNILGLGAGNSLLSDCTFEVTNPNTVTLHGWQEAIGSAFPPSIKMRYEVGTYSAFGGFTWKGEASVDTVHLQSAPTTWFSELVTGVPLGKNYKLKFTNTGRDSIKGSGNVYQ